MNERDYRRFIRSMEEFNDTTPASNLYRANCLKSDFKQRKWLVEVLCFCLMPNHYHLLLRQLIGGGITEFMRKMGTGYTNYFNLKHNRVGPLFQGKFKAVHISKEAHLLYLPHYIHLNPLDLVMPEWREQKIRNADNALRFLESYRWSSYLDYINKRNFPSAVQNYQNLVSVDYKNDLAEWLENFDLTSIQESIIE